MQHEPIFMDILSVFISLAALFFSGISLGWTIYRDIQKPRFKVSIGVKRIFQQSSPPSEPIISVDAVNVGPLPNKVGLVLLQKNWWQRKLGNKDKAHAHIQADYAHQGTSPPSVHSERIEVGELASYAFPYKLECFFNEDWAQIGVADGYGRMHWAPKDQLVKV